MKVIDDVGQMYDPTKVNKDKDINHLINELELKIKNQGMITNARDENLLENLKSIRETNQLCERSRLTLQQLLFASKYQSAAFELEPDSRLYDGTASGSSFSSLV